jgi:hypothetical protein
MVDPREMQSVRFATNVNVTIGSSRDTQLPIRGSLSLIVRDNYFEISHPVPLVGAILGQRFLFVACRAKIKVRRQRLLFGKGKMREWIEIEDTDSRRGIVISIATKRDMRQAWEALVAAGVELSGPPSQ